MIERESEDMIRILVFNYGSTSAKLSIYEDKICVHELSVAYSEKEEKFEWPPAEDVAFKTKAVLNWLESLNLSMDDIDVFAPRLGATFYGGDGGTFRVEGVLKEQVEAKYFPDKPIVHPLFETIEIINQLQKHTNKQIPIFATDPASIDQILPEARLTGLPGSVRRCFAHAINQRAAARKAAEALGKKYNELNLIVAHMGGGTSIGAHVKGRILDCTDGTGDADGPFTSKRAGAVPAADVIKICYSGKYSKPSEIISILKGQSGLQGYLGTSDLREVEKRMDQGDAEAELVFKALGYQISREIASFYATMCGIVDAIVFTGGMAHSHRLVNLISSRVGRMANVFVYPGEMENEALALGAYRVMTGEEEASVYNVEDEYKNAFSKK